MYTTDLDKTHEFIGSTVYTNDDLTESCGKVVESFTDESGQVCFKTDSDFQFSSWDVESFDCEDTIILFED